jgi:hypothetical protein
MLLAQCCHDVSYGVLLPQLLFLHMSRCCVVIKGNYWLQADMVFCQHLLDHLAACHDGTCTDTMWLAAVQVPHLPTQWLPRVTMLTARELVLLGTPAPTDGRLTLLLVWAGPTLRA